MVVNDAFSHVLTFCGFKLSVLARLEGDRRHDVLRSLWGHHALVVKMFGK